MYRVEQNDGETWAVLGPHEATVFTGTLRQCEHWLDRQENLNRTAAAARRAGWMMRLGRLLGRCFSQQRKHHATANSSSAMESASAVSATESTGSGTSTSDT